MTMPETFIKKIYKQTLSIDRFAFFTSFITCFIIHLYAYTNLLSAHDSVAIYNDSTGITNGRFMISVLFPLIQRITTPVIIGIFTSFFLASAIVLISKTLNLNSKFFITILSALVISHPAIVASHYYFTSAYIYAFALLTSVLAVYIIDKHKVGGFIGAVVLLILSLGSYQAYIDLFLCLSIIKLMLCCTDKEIKFKEIISNGIKYVITACSAMGIYYIIWKALIKLTDSEIANYRNYSDLTTSLFDGIAEKLLRTFEYGNNLFFANTLKHTEVFVFISACLYFFSFALSLYLAIKNRSKTALLLPLLFGCMIFASVFIYVISPDTIHTLMVFATICPLILLIKNLEQIGSSSEHNIVEIVFSWVITIGLISLTFNQIVSANVFYTKMAVNYNHSISYCTKLTDRIEQTDGFTKETKVVLVGQGYDIATYGYLDIWPNYVENFLHSDTGLTYKETIVIFIKQNMNTNMNITYDSGEYSERDDVRALETFPAENCMLWDEDTLIVKVDWLPRSNS